MQNETRGGIVEKLASLKIKDSPQQGTKTVEATKKTRRKTRRKSPNAKTTTAPTPIQFTGEISPVTKEAKGTAVRARGPSKKIHVDPTKTIAHITTKTIPIPTGKEANSPVKVIKRRLVVTSPAKELKPTPSPTKSKPDSGPKIKDKNGIRQDASPSPSPSHLPVKKRRAKVHKEKEKDKEDKSPPPKFEPYMPLKQVEAGIVNGTLVKGTLRINPKFYTEAYVSQEDRSLQDYYIASVVDRNRALEGDEVALSIYPVNEWRDNQKRAKVVYILDKIHTRVAVGFLTVIKDKGTKIASFQPRDKRVPHMNIIEASLPPNFLKAPTKYEKILFMAALTDWVVPKFGVGAVVDMLGKANDLKSETKGILLENQVDYNPFPAEVYKYIPKSNVIPPSEYNYRDDLRRECIFTIDPLTAKDLDDAVSCKKLLNGNYEIGVHIADVSYYLTENTPLDEMVAKRATSVYLVENVFHMLPSELTGYCSLLPGKDCATFSVIFEISERGEVIKKRFARTVINSCCQLAYEHAQMVIENPTNNFKAANFPTVHNGFELKQICKNIDAMNIIAQKLRARRFKHGALRIDQIKLGFSLDVTGNPISYFVQEIKDANRMIEEYMLLANIAVAEKIFHSYPELAFLRCHEPPIARLLNDVKKSLEVVGMHLNTSTSKDLQESLMKYNTGDYYGYSRFVALNHLLAKPMMRATYFCSNNQDSKKFYHYALAVPIYTHFTSPIRRYADVMVHRLLSAALGYSPKLKWCPDRVQEIATICNKQKFNAKKAGEASSELYLAYYVEKNQPFITDAVVVGVNEKAFDAVTIQTGTAIRIYTNNLDEGVQVKTDFHDSNKKKMWKMYVVFPAAEHLPQAVQVIDMFQIIQVSLKRRQKTNKLDAQLVRPRQTQQLPFIM